jgi:hypothetical protein
VRVPGNAQLESVEPEKNVADIEYGIINTEINVKTVGRLNRSINSIDHK